MGAEGGSGGRGTTGQVVSIKLEQNLGGQVAQRPTKYDAGKAARERGNGVRKWVSDLITIRLHIDV